MSQIHPATHALSKDPNKISFEGNKGCEQVLSPSVATQDHFTLTVHYITPSLIHLYFPYVHILVIFVVPV